MRGFYKVAAFSLIAGVGSVAVAQAPVTTLVSPDGRLTITFGIHLDQHASTEDGHLVYALKFLGKQVLDDSGLSLDLDGNEPLGEHVHVATSSSGEGVDDFKLANAKASSVHEAYRSLTLQLQEGSAPNRRFAVEARAYNDGVAFRYVIPQQDAIKKVRLRGGEDGVSSDNGRDRLGARASELPQQL